jgi:hypothetical protein
MIPLSSKYFLYFITYIHIHKSNKIKQSIIKYYPRIKLVFLPTRSPELNLIEVSWMRLYNDRQTINNSTFKNGCDMGKAVSDWTNNYNNNNKNKKHGNKTIRDILHKEVITMFT